MMNQSQKKESEGEKELETEQKKGNEDWCKDAPDLVVSKALEEAIRAQKIRLGYKETYDKDP